MNFIDLKAQYSNLKEKIDTNISSVIGDCQFIMGKEVEVLEQILSEYIGVKHSITCASGTDALQLLFMSYGLNDGDVVFCPDVTFISSIEPAVMLGAIPVFCDISEKTYNMCPLSLERQIKKVIEEGKYRPKFVVLVDFLGNPADYNEVYMICEKYKLTLIVDGAQSFGAEYKKHKCCSLGQSSITSFFPTKPLGCYGDGGAVFTNDDKIAELCRSIRSHGKGRDKYDNIRIGMNSRLDTIQAAILLAKFDVFVNYEIAQRNRIARTYNEKLMDRFQIQSVIDDCKSIYAQYTILANDKEERNYLYNKLLSKGIPCMIYYPTPQHKQQVFAGFPVYDEVFKNSKNYCDRTLSLPMHPYLSDLEQDFIIEGLLK